MRRGVRVVLVLLAMGLAATLVSAWACAIIVNPGRESPAANRGFYGHDSGASGAYSVEWWVSWRKWTGYEHVRSRWNPVELNQAHAEQTPAADPGDALPGWFARHRPTTPIAPDTRSKRVGHAFGWPVRSLWYLESEDSIGAAKPKTRRDRLSIELWERERKFATRSTTEPIVLPARPIWRGLAIGTLFYAMLVWLPLYVLLHVVWWRRGVRRLRRGQCPRCCYDISGSEHENCPECGCALESLRLAGRIGA